jgi:acetyl-CoA carboxylase biotin carboxyl carrier protein
MPQSTAADDDRVERRLMDLRKLKTLIDLVSESNITELEITEAEGKVRIVKASPVAASAPGAAMPMINGTVAAASTPVPAAGAADAPAEAEAAPAGHVVTSPMVGTFYRASSPGAQPLVDVGSSIKEGEAICIIEAMKIMNEIEATQTGTIVKLMCDDGQPVEFGQPLFIIG